MPMKRKFPIWAVILVTVLCLCIAAGLLWRPVVAGLAPEVLLVSAVANTAEMVSQRLDSPLAQSMLQAIGCVHSGTMDLTLTLDNLLLDSTYRLTTQSDHAAQRQSALFSTTILGVTTHTGTYLDSDLAAVSSALLTGGDYYGITFDTYAEDLRNSQIYAGLNTQTVQALDGLVAHLDGVYETSSTQPALPELDAPAWVRTVLAYLGSLELSASETQRDGVSCTAVTAAMNGSDAAEMFLEALKTVSANFWLASSLYSEEGAQTPALQEKLEYYRDQTESAVTVTAWVYNDVLVAVELRWTFTENQGDMEINDAEELLLDLGNDPSEDDWTLTLTQEKDGAAFSTKYRFICSGSNWYFSRDYMAGGTAMRDDVTITWRRDSGVLQLLFTTAQGEAEISGTLSSEGNTVTMELEGLQNLFDLIPLPSFLQDADLAFVRGISLSASFSSATAIETPSYVNLDRWELPLLLDLFL